MIETMTDSKTFDPGRADVVPGYIFSKPNFQSRFDAEKEITKRFMTEYATLLSGLPENLMREGLMLALQEVKYCGLREGAPANKVWMLSTGMLPYLAWLSIKVKHPQTTLEQTCQLFVDYNPDAIALATWQLWGLISPEDKAALHTDADAPPAA